jgi:leucyl/phenylalanyl-tRNA---protein transferase
MQVVLAKDVTPEMLIRAYSLGAFPMAEARDDPALHWVRPARRGIMPLDGPHVSRALARRLRRGGFRVTADTAFDAVVSACAARDETWISHGIATLFADLHQRGLAHSLEVWRGDALIGGTYGLALGAAFFAESMFSTATDGSKIALVFLMQRLRAGGFQLCDTQYLTPHLATLGGIEVSDGEYQVLLQRALFTPAAFDPAGYLPDYSDGSGSASSTGAGSGRMQRKGQTS